MDVLFAPLSLTPLQLVAVCVIGAHGLSDLALEGFQFEIYAFCFLLFDTTPDNVLAHCFACASVVHFSEDVGVLSSIALHVALLASAAKRGRNFAFDLVLLYMLAIHVPLHVFRLVDEGRLVGLALMVLGMAAAWCLAATQVESVTVFKLTRWMCMLVISHTASMALRNL